MKLYDVLHVLFRGYFSLFRAESITKENVPAEGPVILAANHMSNWDPPLLATMLHRPVAYMAKEELFKVPVFSQAITACHAFPVKRGAGDRGAIKTAVTVLKQGECLGVFPEGTRSRDGKLHRPESGVALLAAMTGAPVVPAAIIGTDKIFSGKKPLPKLKVIYGKPMKFTGNRKNRDELQAFAQKIMDEIQIMINLHGKDC